ncbi:MAG: archease [Deltaproteobacteria bacterium]|nr:archease [Deltaproteobacteria bacterium]
MGYQYIDHTADLGIKVTSPDIKGLFEEAALAVVKIMGGAAKHKKISLSVTVDGLDRVDTLVRWLQEIIYLIAVKDIRIADLEITYIDDTRLEALVKGIYSHSGLSTEIKAVTYHNLEIKKRHDNLYEVAIIFDT